MKISATALLLAFMSATSTSAFLAMERPSRSSATQSSLYGAGNDCDNINRNRGDPKTAQNRLAQLALVSVVSLSLLSSPLPASADGQTEKFKLPPIDFTDKTRCSLSSSTIGQANAARDKLYDLRQCKLVGAKAEGFDLSGVIMTGTDVSKANFQDAYFSKGYLQDSKFDEADFTNAIVDRANFKGSSLRGTIFKNTVLTGTSFVGADVENADFTEAALGNFDLKNLCRNPTLKGENPITGADTRFSVGCVP